MFKKFCTLATALALTGCVTSATLVKHPDQALTNSKYAPESERQSDGIGVVKIMTSGADFVVEERKEDAYKTMYETCNGKYEILEREAAESNPIYSTVYDQYGSTTYASGYTYEYTYFRCL